MPVATWTSVTIEAATLQGIAPVDLTDPDFNEVDSTRATTAYLAQAKRYIELRLMRELSFFVEKADGPSEFMDAALAINKSHITSLIQSLLAYCFMFHYYEQEAFGSNSGFVDRALLMKSRFEEAFNAFCSYIRLDGDFMDQAESTTDGSLSRHSGTTWVG
jgi:hypothetical protein